METEQLLNFVLDPSLGTKWPEQGPAMPRWLPGQSWRVEYTFRAPAVPVAAAALGDCVTAVWRYRVLEHDERADGTPVVVLRVSPERERAGSYYLVATYNRESLELLDAKRFQGERQLPFTLKRLPPLQQSVKVGTDGRSCERTLTLDAPAALAPMKSQDTEASVNLDTLFD